MIFPIKVRAGQEELIAKLMQQKIEELKVPVYSILIPPPPIKGYIFGEADNVKTLINVAFQVSRETGFRIRVTPLPVKEEELKSWLEEAPIEEFKEGDLVEVVSGTLKGEKGIIKRINLMKKEATIELISGLMKLTITVPLDNIRKVSEND